MKFLGGEAKAQILKLIAKTLEERKAWLILPKQEGELERIINPHVIKSVSIDY